MRLVQLVVTLTALVACSPKAVKLVTGASDQKLRDRPEGAPQTSPSAPPLFVLALDGVSRDLLYQMLQDGELPHMAELLGGDKLAHAYFDDSFLSTMPSTTMDAWTAAMTGRPPADTGVAGNEYFIREKRQFACPAPISFDDADPTLSIYTDHYLDKLVEVPTVYERLRKHEPHIQIWVAMNHLFRGADRMLLAKRTALVKAFEGFVSKEFDELDAKPSPAMFETLDSAAVDAVIDHLEKDPLPDVLTLYLAGTDLYTHQAAEGPDAARQAYLKAVVDKQLGRVVDVLREKGRLDRTWVVVIADHGHTQVIHDKQHALGAAGLDSPAPTLLKQAGFRVRPLKQNVADNDPFSAVLAYGGATAYVYLADRSTCPGATDVCAWNHMPRYEQDVLPAAEALHRGMADKLDMILVRRPRPIGEIDAAIRGLRRQRQDDVDRGLSQGTPAPDVHRLRGAHARPRGRHRMASAPATSCCSRSSATSPSPRTATTSRTHIARGTAARRRPTPRSADRREPPPHRRADRSVGEARDRSAAVHPAPHRCDPRAARGRPRRIAATLRRCHRSRSPASRSRCGRRSRICRRSCRTCRRSCSSA